MSETAYLKKAIGDQLAKGVAHVCEVLPADPVEYLALWLLHEIQLEEVNKKRISESNQLAKQRGAYDVEFVKQKEEAAVKIQREFRLFHDKLSQKRKKQELDKMKHEQELQRQQEEESKTMAAEANDSDNEAE
ncbi:hypothetical protein AKO1_015634 [Acrasis kona]|uniref:DPY30 domain-containing protein 2 n=1 Tax=Acrasis kona TaxID=1008807 RepID=A0AAW2ZFC1_9EUKA